MKILISNDDGVHAIGLAVLAAELSKIATIQVMAPDRNRSGASNSLTVTSPVRISKLYNGSISVEGTPTDCVHLALTGVLDTKFDMVVSGINAGPNLGDDVIYSGTVAAATEGRILGMPAIAVSLAGKDANFQNYQTAAIITRQLVERLIIDHLPAGTILNVNVPDVPIEQIEGIEVTRLGRRHNAESVFKTLDPRGQTVYWVGAPGLEADAGPGTDFHAVNRNRVSITPLQIDLTDYKTFEQISKWTNDLKLT
jgi:5'-nucleotidase